ncbi:MAG TPA: histidine phosphatase family protein [Gammaproteobacteria bacterium]|nr:histidine phosphatase family protein [Gammaproteobacteria bacterium]
MRVQVRPTAKTRQRRRRRRLIALTFYSAIVFGLAWVADTRGTTTIFFVGHAEVEGLGNLDCDSPLSRQGVARAQKLADYMEYVDVVAGPNAIYATQCHRTQQTVAPLAKRIGLEVQIADPYDVVGFMKHVLSEHRHEIVLIATDADMLAPLVEELHGKEGITDIAVNEVFTVVIPTYGKVKTYRSPYSE